MTAHLIKGKHVPGFTLHSILEGIGSLHTDKQAKNESYETKNLIIQHASPFIRTLSDVKHPESSLLDAVSTFRGRVWTTTTCYCINLISLSDWPNHGSLLIMAQAALQRTALSPQSDPGSSTINLITGPCKVFSGDLHVDLANKGMF